MALHGSLKIGGRTYGVVECEYKFTQAVDETGKPTSRPNGGTITIVIPSTNDDDMFFYNWMFHKSEVKAGILRFRLYSNENKISYKTVSFANAAQVIRVGGADSSTFTNAWTNDPIDMLSSNLAEYVKDAIADKLNPL